ncbi:MAG: cyclic nucleotide-regulated FAD-dependent pyridine nucleotide-disulfide oxidoreductase [Marmoricola sp.]|nr:cyclic nucleotide-regulated FAD-dependent pyridine nucleotide-disulfide oxidoreductase [Marmoricola sp.]
MRMRSSSEIPGLEQPETPDASGAYPRLSDEHIMLLSRFGTTTDVPAGGLIFCEGDSECDFFVVLEGTVAVIQETDTEPRLIAVHGPKRFLGDMSLLIGQNAYLTAVAREDVKLLDVPIEGLMDAVAEDPTLGDLVLRAFMIRRSLHSGIGAGLRIIGSRYSADSRRIRDFVSRNRIPHRWVDLEEDPEAEALLQRLKVPPEMTPVVIWKGQSVLRNPSNAELAKLLGLRTVPSGGAHDLVVVGAGPAGLAAAVYGASEGLSTIVLDSVATGGQAATSSRIENYLGFPAGISGAELADRAVVQARRFGATFTVPGTALSLGSADGHHLLRLADGGELDAHAVILATGAKYRRLEAKGMDRLEASSVYYAATESEARLCRDDPVMVVGGGNSAGQAAVFLARNASVVNLAIRHDDLYRDMSRYLADRVVQTPQIRLWRSCEVAALVGEEALEAVVLDDLQAQGEQHRVESTALFVMIGAIPQTSWLDGQIPLDDRGFVVTGSRGGSSGIFETERRGVFAVGDVRSGSVKRVASAVGEGAIAVRLVHDYLQTVGRR